MPTYLYQCTKGHEFESDQRISDPELETCQLAKCKAGVKRLIAGKVIFDLKGNGWTPKPKGYWQTAMPKSMQ